MREVCADVTGRYLEQLSGVTQLMANVSLGDFDTDDFEDDFPDENEATSADAAVETSDI